MMEERSEFGYMTNEEKEAWEERQEAVREVLARRQKEAESHRKYTEDLKQRWE